MRTVGLEQRRKRLQWLACCILVIGLGSAVAVFVHAGGGPEAGMRYEVIDGVSYPTPLEDTKQFSREMELYGGKSLVLVDALLRWFAALWHGKPLAAVLALVSTGIAALLWYVARHPGPAYPYDDAGR